jgi:hypothetical protein
MPVDRDTLQLRGGEGVAVSEVNLEPSLGPILPALKLEALLVYRLATLSNAISHAIATSISPFKLGVAEWQTLATLAALGEATATKIGARASMSKTRVSRATGNLLLRDQIAK